MASETDTQASAATSPRRSRARRAYTILAAVAAIAVGAYFVHHWWVAGQVSTDDAQVDADVVPVLARVSGPVKLLEVHDNQQVAAGDVIVRIDPSDYETRVHQTEAELEAANAQAAAADAQVAIVRSSSSGGLSTARAQLTGAGAAVRTAGAEVQAAEAAVARATSDLAKSESDLARATRLREAEANTAPELESAQAARNSARAALDQAEAKLASAREQRNAATSRVAEAQGRVAQSSPVDQQIQAAEASSRLGHARIKSAEASVEQARLALSYTTVKAPTAGFVSRLAVHAGQSVQIGQVLVMLVPAQTYVIANVKETEVGDIKPGNPADVTVDAFPGVTFHGKVDSVAAATGARMSLLPPDNATGNFVKVVQRVPIKIVWDRANNAPLRAGLSAEVTIHVQ